MEVLEDWLGENGGASPYLEAIEELLEHTGKGFVSVLFEEVNKVSQERCRHIGGSDTNAELGSTVFEV
jgi:hypothetical protein